MYLVITLPHKINGFHGRDTLTNKLNTKLLSQITRNWRSKNEHIINILDVQTKFKNSYLAKYIAYSCKMCRQFQHLYTASLRHGALKIT